MYLRTIILNLTNEIMKNKLFFIMTAMLLTAANTAWAQTEEEPIDRTNLITNPSFESALRGWVSSELAVQGNDLFTKREGAIYLEKWVGAGSAAGNAAVKQTVKNLPVGKYRLTVAAQNQDQNNKTAQKSGAYIYAGTAQTPVYTPDDYSVDFTAVIHELEIGFEAKNAKGNWLSVDNFRLLQIGTVTKDEVAVAVQAKIDEANGVYDSSKPGAEELKAAIDNATAQITNEGVDADGLANQIPALDKALFAYQLANATPGSGNPPKVTKTDHYICTGATEALVRATITGSNMLERGVCWSTERNPTVLDERTTEYHTLNGNIYHIRGLQPSTVYYVRPYAMNKTYKVAYGDEVKIVTHPKGTCTGSWNYGAPDAEANTRCALAIQQTIDYFNEWTGIMGFHLTGNYGSGTPTADCSYGGWMRIGPNAANQAIGTVLHETGHGVGVGTCDRYADTNVHNWTWFGREANRIYQFLENQEGNSEYVWVGDGTHAWGANSTYDWLVNGAWKDTHEELQYAGGMCILYGMFIDGMNPTYSYSNGISGYTYNFDDTKKYYLMNKSVDGGLGVGLLFQQSNSLPGWKPLLTDEVISDKAAWYLEYDAQKGYYLIKNADSGRYLSHPTGSTAMGMKRISGSAKPGETERFQFMPDRKDVTLKAGTKKVTTHGYWLTWNENGDKAMGANAMGRIYGSTPQVSFDYRDSATSQQWIIISEDELPIYQEIATIVTGLDIPVAEEADPEKAEAQIEGIYNAAGMKLNGFEPGVNLIRYSDGTVKKVKH